MNWRLAALLPLMAALSACAEGGSRGSGIFTEVRGNVESVQTAAVPARLRASLHSGIENVAPAATAIAGIRVAVEGTGIRGETDTSGNFSLRGNFEGMINLVFQLPDDGGQAQIGLNVPAGGQLTLNNVTVDAPQGAAVADTQGVDFDGIITGIDCRSLILTLVSTHQGPDDTDEYTLRLDTSSVRDAQGDPVACADIRDGEQAVVQGFVNPDGTFGDATVDLD
jgi:hypothetical protein